MLDIDTSILVPVISALGGALVGALVSEVRVFVGSWRRRRLALRQILFQLLDFRHDLVRADPTLVLEAWPKYVSKRFGQTAAHPLTTPEGRRAARVQFAAVIEALVDEESLDNYGRWVRRLAPYDPLLAYRLSSQDRIAACTHILHAFYEGYAEAADEDGDAHEVPVIQDIEHAFVDTARRRALDELAESARLVAWKVGILSFLRVKRLVRRQDEVDTEDLESYFDDFVSHLEAEAKRKTA